MHDFTKRELSPNTLAVAAGRPPRSAGQPVNPPVVLSSTYFSTGTPRPDELLYARIDTETWHPLEETLAALEHGQHGATVFASGLAACVAALSLVRADARIIAPRHSYQMALGLFADQVERYGAQLVKVDIADTDAVVSEIARGGDLLWIESPTNPMLEVADLPALIKAAHKHGLLVCVDNTFATPLGQNPLDLGADLVLHSVTKYLAGHSDVVLGALVARSAEHAEAIHQFRAQHGNGPGPWEAWLALRGIRTLALRVRQAAANAQTLAERLSAHPRVLEVRYPGLPQDPGHQRAKTQMRNFGSVIGVRVAGGPQGAQEFVERVKLWVPATSLGGVESTLERRRRFTSESETVPQDLVRMSVGIEDVEDLWADLVEALQ